MQENVDYDALLESILVKYGKKEFVHMACQYCVSEGTVTVMDFEGMAHHVESMHHLPVLRPGETDEEGMERFRREQPLAGTDKCRCPRCKELVNFYVELEHM